MLPMSSKKIIHDALLLWKGEPANYQKQWFANLPWWPHKMETFSALLGICAGNAPVTGEFPTQRPVTQSFDIFFDQQKTVE